MEIRIANDLLNKIIIKFNNNSLIEFHFFPLFFRLVD